MPAIDTRHEDKDKLFTLLSIRDGLIDVNYAIKQQKAKMEKEDVKEVLEEYANKE